MCDHFQSKNVDLTKKCWLLRKNRNRLLVLNSTLRSQWPFHENILTDLQCILVQSRLSIFSKKNTMSISRKILDPTHLKLGSLLSRNFSLTEWQSLYFGTSFSSTSRNFSIFNPQRKARFHGIFLTPRASKTGLRFDVIL